MFNGKSVLTGDYTHYYSKDPAFDAEHEDFDHERWVETQDAKFLPMKNGVKPVEFTMHRLDAMEEAFIADSGGGNQAAAWAVRLAVKKLAGLPDEELDLVVEAGYRCVSREWLAQIKGVDDGDLFYELVMRIRREKNHVPKS